MYNIHLSSRVDLSGTRASKLGTIVRFAFILAPVIDVGIAKTVASNLTVFQNTCLLNGPYSGSRNT